MGGDVNGGGAIPSAPTQVASGSVTRHTLQVAGSERSFLYHSPSALDPAQPAPVLIVAHGFGQTATDL